MKITLASTSPRRIEMLSWLGLDFDSIDPQAPLAQAILNHKEGEEVEFLSPSGPLKIKILRIN